MKYFLYALCLAGLLLLVVIGVKVAIGANKPGGETAVITCHFFYRSQPTKAKGESGQFTIRIPLSKGSVPEIDLGISEKMEFEDLACQAAANYNALSIHFFDAGKEKNLPHLLYQFDRKPVNQFGDHGFTGLHYVYHPVSGAELQFWATVE